MKYKDVYNRIAAGKLKKARQLILAFKEKNAVERKKYQTLLEQHKKKEEQSMIERLKNDIRTLFKK